MKKVNSLSDLEVELPKEWDQIVDEIIQREGAALWFMEDSLDENTKELVDELYENGGPLADLFLTIGCEIFRRLIERGIVPGNA